MAQVFGTADEERRAVPMVWHTITREARRLSGGEDSDPRERRAYWSGRREATRQAADLARQALACCDLEGPVRADIDWLRRCLEVGEAFCEGLTRTYELLDSRSAAGATELQRFWTSLAARVREEFSRDYTDPLGGDLGCWEPTVELLASVAERLS